MVKRSVLHIQSLRQTRDQTRAELALTKEAVRARISTLEGSVKTKSDRVRDLTAVNAPKLNLSCTDFRIGAFVELS